MGGGNAVGSVRDAGLLYFSRIIAVAGILFSCSSVMAEGIVRLEERAFLAGAGLITFSKPRMGARNPSYSPQSYGGGPNAPNVTTGGWFVGQRLSGSARRDCPGAAASACVVGQPVAPLRLDPRGPGTMIARDGAMRSRTRPGARVLTGRSLCCLTRTRSGSALTPAISM